MLGKTAHAPTLDQNVLRSINGDESSIENIINLENIGGVDGFAKAIGLSVDEGLSSEQVVQLRDMFGSNVFPETPFSSFFELLLGALDDTTLLILLAAAAVSFGIGYYQDPVSGWIDGAAIFAAVFLVANIAAGNDYSKEIQFLELEKASENDQLTSVLRNGSIERVNPIELVIGDVLVLQVSYIPTAPTSSISKPAHFRLATLFLQTL